METFSALLAICAGNSPVNSPHKGQRRGALIFFLICALSKQWWGWWFETPSCPLWRLCNGNSSSTSYKVLYPAVLNPVKTILFVPICKLKVWPNLLFLSSKLTNIDRCVHVYPPEILTPSHIRMDLYANDMLHDSTIRINQIWSQWLKLWWRHIFTREQVTLWHGWVIKCNNSAWCNPSSIH